jgi:hypothetical protein
MTAAATAIADARLTLLISLLLSGMRQRSDDLGAVAPAALCGQVTER